MKPILYWYPMDYPDEDEPNGKLLVREQGRIIPHQLNRELCDITVEARGFSFHLIFGNKVNGKFLCIPNWNVGCELSELRDRKWNTESLLKTESLAYGECTAIAWALYSIGDLMRFIH